jgi:energy-coupling factor transport system ATP-binding protein
MSIKIDNVSYIYQKGTPFARQALKDLTFDIHDNEILGIIGLQGSGKSTLLQILNGLIKPTKGRVWVDNQNIKSLTKKELKGLRQKVGLAFQHPEQQIFELRVYDEIAFGPRNLGIDSWETEKRIREALDGVGLSFELFKDRPTNTLSSGEKRRVAIAGILALKPGYLLLDEPTSGLDFEGSEVLIDKLKVLNQKHMTTIVIVSHNLYYLTRICDRIMLLKDGGLILLEDTSLLTKYYKLLKEHFIEVPVFQGLIYQLNNRGWGLNTAVRTPQQAGLEIAKRLKTSSRGDKSRS